MDLSQNTCENQFARASGSFHGILSETAVLPRHNRFYQARSDSRHLKRGVNDFSTMPNLFVITILNSAPLRL